MIPRELWISNIIDSLKEIASEEFQIKGWVQNEIHDYCTFVETLCGFFMECAIEDFLQNHAKNFGFTEDQIKKIDLVRLALDQYSCEHGSYEDPIVIVNDPKWHKIRLLARDALDALNVKDYLDPSKAIVKYILLNRTFSLSSSKFSEDFWMDQENQGRDPFFQFMQDFFIKFKAREIAHHYHEYEITEEQQIIFKQFIDALETFWHTHKHEKKLTKILHDPKWRKIQSLADQVIAVFNFEP